MWMITGMTKRKHSTSQPGPDARVRRRLSIKLDFQHSSIKLAECSVASDVQIVPVECFTAPNSEWDRLLQYLALPKIQWMPMARIP